MILRSCRVRGAEVSYSATGPRQAPALIALHGYPDSSRIFGRLLAELPDRRAIAVDWPGQGRSERVTPCDGPTERAAWVADVLDALGIERCALLGHDMGALPALCFARDFGARAEHVFLANALLSNDAPTSLAIRVMRSAKAYRLALPFLGGLVFERCLRTFLEAPLTHELRDELRSDFVRPESLRALVAACDAYDAELPGILGTMESVKAPVHALWGTRERHFPEEHARALASVLPSTTVDVIEGGHWMVHERPAEVAAAIQSRWR
jgi:pimeloyl-ACP methyl ester carboxylesterase